ncbi:hypothetical protein IJ472_06520 [bacterium]|nr:hypothetical protein [bacterium]
MKVSAINNISFGRRLTPQETQEFEQVQKEAKQLVGQTGKSIFIVHDACLPQSATKNTGVSNLAAKESQDFFKFMKPLLGFNIVEVLPQGQVANSKGSGLYCAYSGTALSLGNHQINPELLTTEEFGKLLTPEEFQKIVKANTKPDKETIANYDNVMAYDGEQNKMLKIAHDRFLALDETSPLKQKYNQYIKENAYWLDIPRSFEKDQEYFRFRQFLADEHLRIGKEALNKEGIKLCGDCLIGFSADEIAAYPKAFKEGYYIGDRTWDLRALDYDALQDPTSDAAKLLKTKVQLFAKRYDMIRFDVGWAYLNPRMTNEAGNHTYQQYLGDKVLKFIEDAVREVKGDDFDLRNLIYEFEGGDIFKQNSPDLMDEVVKRTKIFGTTHMHEKDGDLWGSNNAFLRRGWDPDYFVVGVGNHDPQPLRQIAHNIADTSMPDLSAHKYDAIPPLSRILNIAEETLHNPIEFAKAKWAEPMMARHNEMFYMDVLGREERFDMQNLNCVNDPARNLSAHRNYAYKIPADYKAAYHAAVEEGYGFNIMDSLAKIFKVKNLDETHPELFTKIVNFRDILLEKSAEIIEEITTPQEIKTISKKSKTPWIIAGAVALTGVGTALGIRHSKTSKDSNLDKNA